MFDRSRARLEGNCFSFTSRADIPPLPRPWNMTTYVSSQRMPEPAVRGPSNKLPSIIPSQSNSRGIATIVESRLRDVVDNKSSRDEIDGVMKFLMKQFDTLSLAEVLLALKLIRATAHIPEYHTARSHLQPNLSQRAVYLLSTSPDVSEEALVSFLRLGSHSFFRTADLNRGFELVMEKLDTHRLLRELTSIHRLRNVATVRDVLSKFVCSIPVSFSPRTLREACLLIDLCVICDVPGKNRRLNHMCERALPLLESSDRERYTLFGTIELLVQNEHSHLLKLECFKAIIGIVVERGVFPSKGLPSRTHLYLAYACSRIDDCLGRMSPNGFNLFLKGMSFDALELQDLRYQLGICLALVLHDRKRSYASQEIMCDAVNKFVASLSRRHLVDPSLLVGYASLANELRLHISPYRWWAWCEKIVAFQESSSIKAGDILRFIRLVNQASSCPPSLRSSILKSLNPLALLEVRKCDPLSADELEMVLNDPDYDESIRHGVELNQARFSKASGDLSEIKSGTITGNCSDATYLVNS